jgi:hypothetical protein
MRKVLFVFAVLFALSLFVAPDLEAQVVYTHPAWHGVPAAPGNGSIRHYNNGYVGVNPRHASRIPMKWGTGPTLGYGPVVTYPPYPTCYPGMSYPAPYVQGGGYIQGGGSGGHGYIQGGGGGNGWYIQGGAVW